MINHFPFQLGLDWALPFNVPLGLRCSFIYKVTRKSSLREEAEEARYLRLSTPVFKLIGRAKGYFFRRASPIELAVGVKACLKVASYFQARWFNSRLDKGSYYTGEWENVPWCKPIHPIPPFSPFVISLLLFLCFFFVRYGILFCGFRVRWWGESLYPDPQQARGL